MLFGPYPAQVLDVHDGDTMKLRIDLGFDIAFTGNCRVFGINAPELRTVEGKDAAAFAKALVPVDTLVRVLSHGWDKYGGRFDGSVVLPDGRDFASVMVDSNHAVRYLV